MSKQEILIVFVFNEEMVDFAIHINIIDVKLNIRIKRIQIY